MSFLRSLRLDALLSFRPGSDPIALTPLNVLIGPNGSGKSNLIEAIELLHATPTAFAAAIRDGGGAAEWLWKGEGGGSTKDATIDAIIQGANGSVPGRVIPDLRYHLAFRSVGSRTEVTDEAIERTKPKAGQKDVFFFYRFQGGHPAINVRQPTATDGWTERRLERQSLTPDESVLSQRKDPDLYPELTWLGQQFSRIQTFREWSFGRYGALRQPQPADLPTDTLLPDSRNLALVLNKLEHSDAGLELNRALSTFLPRFKRFSTRVEGSTVQFNLHEDGLRSPVPATRLSDGTIRFIALLALLLSPSPPPLICIEEPELGLHPDALKLLADLMLEASARTQLIVSTHSDALVSALTEEADSVLVCEHLDGTVFRRLESAKLRFWMDKYRLGEIWRIGELGGNL
jgi:predicted ATPase